MIDFANIAKINPVWAAQQVHPNVDLSNEKATKKQPKSNPTVSLFNSFF